MERSETKTTLKLMIIAHKVTYVKIVSMLKGLQISFFPQVGFMYLSITLYLEHLLSFCYKVSFPYDMWKAFIKRSGTRNIHKCMIMAHKVSHVKIVSILKS